MHTDPGLVRNFRPTFTVELDNMERILIQMELTVIAGDQESYKISAIVSHNMKSQ